LQFYRFGLGRTRHTVTPERLFTVYSIGVQREAFVTGLLTWVDRDGYDLQLLRRRSPLGSPE
jgi:hypothetical protein